MTYIPPSKSAFKRKAIPDIRLDDGESYESRSHFLTILGFNSYQEYLKSPLWQKIRSRVLKRQKFKCQVCFNPANQVHHTRYHLNDLKGKKLKYLFAVCGSCHKEFEFTASGKKKNLNQANSKFQWLKTKDNNGTTAMQRSRMIHNELDAQFDAIFTSSR